MKLTHTGGEVAGVSFFPPIILSDNHKTPFLDNPDRKSINYTFCTCTYKFACTP